MIVVSDTSPLAYLVQLGVADCLPALYGAVFIPATVAQELRHESCPAATWMKSIPSWLTVATPHRIPAGLELDLGEQEAIALALELGAKRVLLDERKGRDAAKALGLNVAGTLAVILDGAKHGLLDGAAALDELSRTNFYASSELIQAVRKKLEDFTA